MAVSAELRSICCATCSVRDLCIPAGVESCEMAVLNQRIGHRPELVANQFIFHGGDPARGLYVVKRGSVTSSRLLGCGDEQIVGLHLPGEIFGFDGFCDGRHQLTTQALENTELCLLDFPTLEELFKEIPALHQRILGMLSRELRDHNEHQVLMGRRFALERVALFLVRYTERLQSAGLNDAVFQLSNSRQDLANYLGIQVETISRAFGKLRDQKVIGVQGRTVEILQFDRLHQLAGLEAGERLTT